VPWGTAVAEHRIPLETRGSSPVWDLEFTADSLFFLLHRGDPTVQVIAHDGKPLRAIQTGARQAAALGFKGDSLWVYDAGANRISLFTRDGKPIRTWTALPSTTTANLEFAGVLKDGTTLAYALKVAGQPLHGAALIRFGNLTPAKPDTLARFDPGTSARTAISYLDGLIWLITDGQPEPDKGVIGVIKLQPTGEAVMSKEFNYEPLPSGDSLLHSVTDIFEAANGSLLVRRENVDRDTLLWTVLSRIGVRVAELYTPRSALILVADGTYVYGIESERGKPALTRYRIERTDTLKK
jgi:hypothetical protein